MKAPRSLVPKTSGQGVSRYSYQEGYQLGNRGTGGGPLKKAPVVKLDRDLLKGNYQKPKRFAQVKQAPMQPLDYGTGPMFTDVLDQYGKK